MGILKSHGALDQFAKLQGEAGRLEAEVESLRQRFEAAEQLDGTKNELEIERNRLTLRLRRDFSEQKGRLGRRPFLPSRKRPNGSTSQQAA